MYNMTCQIDWNGTVLGSKDPWVGQYENLRIRSMDLYLYIHALTCIIWSSYVLLHPWIHRSLISTDPQILVSLHPWVHRSVDLFISICLDPHISLFMHWQALISANPQMSVSLYPWFLWFSDVYMHRSSDPQILVCRICTSVDPQISVSVHPQICRYSDLPIDLWIFLSLHPQIRGSPDIHISASTDPSTPT